MYDIFLRSYDGQLVMAAIARLHLPVPTQPKAELLLRKIAQASLSRGCPLAPPAPDSLPNAHHSCCVGGWFGGGYVGGKTRAIGGLFDLDGEKGGVAHSRSITNRYNPPLAAATLLTRNT